MHVLKLMYIIYNLSANFIKILKENAVFYQLWNVFAYIQTLKLLMEIERNHTIHINKQ